MLHLGDYVYEYAPGGVSATTPGRPRAHAEPLRECLDPDRLPDPARLLQARGRPAGRCTPAHPMVAVWDDHEIANDTWKDGAENHDPATEGDWLTRATAGRRAWLEWLPVRHTDPDDWYRINRRLRFGDLVDLWMLDERRFRTSPRRACSSATGPSARHRAPRPRMIGDEQEHWLVAGLAGSTRQVEGVGNQVPFYPTDPARQRARAGHRPARPAAGRPLEQPLLAALGRGLERLPRRAPADRRRDGRRSTTSWYSPATCTRASPARSRASRTTTCWTASRPRSSSSPPAWPALAPVDHQPGRSRGRQPVRHGADHQRRRGQPVGEVLRGLQDRLHGRRLRRHPGPGRLVTTRRQHQARRPVKVAASYQTVAGTKRSPRPPSPLRLTTGALVCFRGWSRKG